MHGDLCRVCSCGTRSSGVGACSRACKLGCEWADARAAAKALVEDGRAQRKTGNHEEAIVLFEQALDLDPANGQAANLAGE